MLWPLITKDVSSLRKPPLSSLGSELAAELFSFMVHYPLWKEKKICSGGTKTGTQSKSEIYTADVFFNNMEMTSTLYAFND